MRALFIALLLVLQLPAAYADSPGYRAGVTQVGTRGSSEALVWYPTDETGGTWQIGEVVLPARHDAIVAAGKFPMVLLSHGGGRTGGSPLVLRELSSSLARQGFIVVVPFHGRAGLRVRPLQVKAALDAVLGDPRFMPHADPARLGMLGFSLGGAVTLQLAGAVPDGAHFEGYCRAHPEDVMACANAPDAGASTATRQPTASQEKPPSLPLKAIALLDPLAAAFPNDGLRNVTMPVLLLRPQDSKLLADGNAVGLAKALPRPPAYQTLPGGHFIFTDKCSPNQESAAPELCSDPPGVDRIAVQAKVHAAVANFFRDALGS